MMLNNILLKTLIYNMYEHLSYVEYELAWSHNNNMVSGN